MVLRQNVERPNVERPNVEWQNVKCYKSGQMSNAPNVERPNVEFYNVEPSQMSNALNVKRFGCRKQSEIVNCKNVNFHFICRNHKLLQTQQVNPM
jgi:hypothetical protein